MYVLCRSCQVLNKLGSLSHLRPHNILRSYTLFPPPRAVCSVFHHHFFFRLTIAPVLLGLAVLCVKIKCVCVCVCVCVCGGGGGVVGESHAC